MKKNLKWKNNNILKKKQIYYHNQEKFYYICPHCQHIITFENEVLEDIILACPNCGQEGKIQSFPKKQNITDTNISSQIIENAPLIDERKNINIPSLEAKILGILLILLGIALHYIVNLFSIKISIMLIIIGAVIFTFIPSTRKIFIKFHRTNSIEKPNNESNTRNSSLRNYIYNFPKKQIDISEKIAIVLILWIIFIYILTGVNNIDIFFIFVYLGFLIMYVFSNELMHFQLRQRMNVFTIAFLIIFLIIIIRRILMMVNI